VARDYKHARRRSAEGMSGWAGLMVGLVVGLTVALSVYLYDRRLDSRPSRVTPPLATEEASGSDKPAPASQTAEPETQFDFYEMLPKFEVVIPEKEDAVRRDPGGTAGGAQPGTYVLQAGSFRNTADADRMRATLALQGIESKIQKVTVDADTWHRVRIGPISDPARLDEIRRRLREAQIHALLIRIGD
jgi:cell division protein FtsN